jgi:hypothetical protein
MDRSRYCSEPQWYSEVSDVVHGDIEIPEVPELGEGGWDGTVEVVAVDEQVGQV